MLYFTQTESCGRPTETQLNYTYFYFSKGCKCELYSVNKLNNLGSPSSIALEENFLFVVK